MCLCGLYQSVSLTHLLAWRTGPHAHTRCTRLAREPTRGTLSPAVALGPDCWTHNTQLTGQLTRWRCIVGFSGTDTGEEGGAQGRGHRTHELISHIVDVRLKRILTPTQKNFTTKERRDSGGNDKGENDESGTTARWHEGCSEKRRETAKGDRKRQTP